LTAALGMSEELWQDVREICGGGTRCHVALRQTSAERVTDWRGSSPLTQFGTFFIHFHRESCCLKPWQREVTDAHKAKATTLPATLPLTQKPRHFMRLSFSPTPTHRIFCNAILPHHYLPVLHGSSLVYCHPQTLGRVVFLLKSAVMATFIKSRLCSLRSHEWTTSPDSPRRRWCPFQSSCAQAKTPSSDARTTYTLRHKRFQRLMAACMQALSVSVTACQCGLRRMAHSGSHFRG
jgi:hypothetical protein